MKILNINLPNHDYPIFIEDGLLDQVGSILRSKFPGDAVAVVSDETIWPFHGERIMESLSLAGFKPSIILIQPGEHSKTLEGFKALCEDFSEMGLLRTDPIISFGGGVVGDLTGFAAASYMRGTNFVQIPTTLLAQVDSSVGGKTGVNLPLGKNLVGAFWQPKMVIVDPKLLETLAQREFSAGMAEVIKYGAIASEELFELIESLTPGQISAHLEEIIYRCCDIKITFVEKDEYDFGERMLLNFGHTFGHAIESLGGYEKHLHGEAVGIGMVMATKVGETLGITPKGSATRLASVLQSYGLPVDWENDQGSLISGILMDKKSSREGLQVILLKKIGSALIQSMREDQLRELLERSTL